MYQMIFIAVAALVWNSEAVYAQSLQEQQFCANQARVAFQEHQQQTSPAFKLATSDYQSHYNTKINRYLIHIQSLYDTRDSLVS